MKIIVAFKKKFLCLILSAATAGGLFLCGCKGSEEDKDSSLIETGGAVREAVAQPVIPDVTVRANDEKYVSSQCRPGDIIKCVINTDNKDEDAVCTITTKINEGKTETRTEKTGDEHIVAAPDKPCFFKIMITVRSKGQKRELRLFHFTVSEKTGKPFREKNSRLSADYVCVGKSGLEIIPEFEGGTPPYRYTVNVRDRKGNTEKKADSSEADILSFAQDTSPGIYKVLLKAYDSEGRQAEKELKFTAVAALPLKSIYQYSDPELPTGCEATALTSCLNYYGYRVTKNEIADKYLDKQEFAEKNGVLIGGDPELVFAGDPNSLNAYGCFAPCLRSAAENYFRSIGSQSFGEIIHPETPQELYSYLEKGQPVIIWSTYFLYECYPTDTWETPEGKKITWLYNEHCYVLTGMSTNKKHVFVVDPMQDTDKLTRYSSSLFLKRYRELGGHAMVINKR